MSFVLELPLKELQCFDPTKSKLNFCFVICKHDIHDYNGEDFSWVDLKHIPYCKARYMDHVTRAFKCQYHIVTVSLVHFSTTSLFKQSSGGPLKKRRCCHYRWPKTHLHGRGSKHARIHWSESIGYGKACWRLHVSIWGVYISVILQPIRPTPRTTRWLFLGEIRTFPCYLSRTPGIPKLPWGTHNYPRNEDIFFLWVSCDYWRDFTNIFKDKSSLSRIPNQKEGRWILLLAHSWAHHL